MDWLSVTVGPVAAGALRSQSEHLEDGTAGRGYRRSERRAMMGGCAWRRWDPVVPSPRWGVDYESWEWSGGDARWPASWLRGVDGVRPSRVDVAYDYRVDDRVRPGGVLRRCLPYIRARGISTGGSGQGGIWTRYVGSRSSERRVRIYRKDARDAAWLVTYGPTLRVELELHDALARGWWAVWRESESRGIAAAAGHIQAMLGRSVLPDAEEPPPPLEEPGAEADAAQMVLQFAEQHASVLHLASSLGVDLGAIVDEVMGRWAKSSWSRHRERLRKFEGVSGAALTDLVIRMIRSRTLAVD